MTNETSQYIHGTDPQEQSRLTLMNSVINEPAIREMKLQTGQRVLDVGSGLAAPALFWKSQYEDLKIVCVNINMSQLKKSKFQSSMFFTNSTATKLPFTDSSADRIISLESAQHFKPLDDFISESKRILKPDGLLIMAIPVTVETRTSLSKLGILSFTWSSEHYGFDYVKSSIINGGFDIEQILHVGSNVYEPLSEYYAKNRESLRVKILEIYPSYVEKILFKSLQKMKQVSEKKIIDYVLIKCRT